MIYREFSILIVGVSLLVAGCNDVTNTDLESQNKSSELGNVESFMYGSSTEGTILEIAGSDENFSILAQAVTFIGLDKALYGKRQFTVFAPTDDAFEALLNELSLPPEELLVEENKELVRKILLYHVAPGNRPAEDVLDSDKIRTVLKKFIDVEVDDRNVLLGNDENGFVNLIAADISASNGVIHVIDGVLQPPTHRNDDNDDDENEGDESDYNKGTDTIFEIADSDENFSILAQALVFAELDDALNHKRQFTVFATTNDAFETLLNELGLSAEELLVEANKQLVRNILLYHLAPGNRPAEDVIDSDKIRTLLKKFIEVEIDNGSIQVGNNENGYASLLATDIFASNGVIHVIDAVLQPPTHQPDDEYQDDDEDDD
jgi:uncharacterized surface protein with fasciclin (FAS1) repeats